MDRAMYRWINRFADRTHWAHGGLRFYADFGIVLFAILLLAAYIDARQHDDHAQLAASIWAGASALVALGIGQVIGGAIDRLRPYETMNDVHVLVSRTTDFAIPSDHATVAGAVAAGLLLTHHRWGRIAAVAAVLMAFTRVYVGAHYPADVLAGLGLGAVVAAGGHYLIVPSLRRLIDRLAHTGLRPLLSRTAPTSAL